MAWTAEELGYVEAGSALVAQLREQLAISDERVTEIRAAYYAERAGMHHQGGPDTWPFFTIAVPTEAGALAVAAAVPDETAVAVQIHPEAEDRLVA